MSNDFPDDPLTHSGPGSSSTSYDFGSPGHTEVSYVISDMDAITTGKPDGRYIDLVTVSYTDVDGSQIYGTFSGENTSSTTVDIAGPIYSVTVTLEDGWDGDPPGTLSVDPGPISSCLPSESLPEALLEAEEFGKERFDHTISDLSVYPNPANELLTVRYQLNRESEIIIRITNINGIPVHDLNALPKADMQEYQIDISQMPAGVYSLHLGSKDQVISRKFVIMR